MRLAGIDIAWKSKDNPSAIAIGRIEDSQLIVESVESGIVGIDLIKASLAQAENLVGIAIDGPLVIPNESGQRRCENELSKDYGRYKAGCHSTNKEQYPDAESVKLASDLLVEGFDHLQEVHRGKFQIKCYPHPSLIEIFSLPERVLYKKGNTDDKKRGQKQLLHLLKSLNHSDKLPMTFHPSISEQINDSCIDQLQGQGLKNHEDALDAIVCLYISALYAFESPGITYGSIKEGYIWIPKQYHVSNNHDYELAKKY